MEEKTICRKRLYVTLFEDDKTLVELPVTSPELLIGLLSAVAVEDSVRSLNVVYK